MDNVTFKQLKDDIQTVINYIRSTGVDYMIGDTRVICNPRGYEMYQENFEFNSDLEVEV